MTTEDVMYYSQMTSFTKKKHGFKHICTTDILFKTAKCHCQKD